MEYAEQTLAQVLHERALSGDEAQELLLPTLDALAFLHRNRLVHSQLKPSNFLAVDDRLKLASDTIRLAGNFASGTVRPSPYDPPEQKGRGVSTAGDVWGLGITLVEALTQHAPAWLDKQRETASLPADFPVPFADTVQRCLSLTPADRPTVMELQAQYKPAPQALWITQPERPTHAASRKATAPHFPKRNLLLTIAVVLLISLVVQGALHYSDTSQGHVQPPAVPVPIPAPVAPAAISKPNSGLSGAVSRPSPPSPPPAATSPSVLLEVSPDVPRTFLDKIQGRTLITVRVLVDPSGDVIGALLDSPGTNKSLDRLANKAALEWKFAPDENQGARVWVLRFAFSRDGVTTDATALQ
jgi:TonB family protein